MEESSPTAHEESNAYDGGITTDEEVKTLLVDKFTIEKIVSESPNSKEVIFTRSKSSETVSASTRRITKRTRPEKRLRIKKGQDCFDVKIQKQRINGSGKLNGVQSFGKGLAKVPAGRVQKAGSASVLDERKIILIKFKSSSISNLVTFDEFGKYAEPSNACRVPPIIPPKPIRNTKYDPNVNLKFLAIVASLPDDAKENVNSRRVEHEKRDGKPQDSNELTSTITQARLQTSHFEIERIQKNLIKIDSATAEGYKQKLPILHPIQLKVCPISDEYFDKNINNIFDKNLLSKHNYNQKLKVVEKRLLETDFNYVPEIDLVSDETLKEPRWSREVSEVEKRWSGEFFDVYNDRNSSESSKSSYIEELGSVSSHDGVIEDIRRKSYMKSPFQQTDRVQEYHKDIEEVSEDTVSTIDSTSCVEERIKSVDEGIRKKVCSNNSYESHGSTLKESLSKTALLDEKSLQEDNRIYTEPTESEENISNNKPELSSEGQTTLISEKVIERETRKLRKSDGYAKLIREMTMEPGPSKCLEEKKKKSGLRRLLPGLFSPKDSRKDYKKEQKDRKKRDERHFSQHQQNGIYTRSPDTMNLNEDIKRNVNLDTSLNGSIIEERLNEIKQELFPDQGMTTSTPDHFLQDRSFHERRPPRLCTANSSLSSIVVDDKWIDQNIISGSPDMKKFKQQNRKGGEKFSLEHKHSFQESRPRFFRNHTPTGRTSAPPSERYLIRPRAIHPIDRPLPAIPQKGELCSYQNHEEIREHRPYSRESKMNYQGGAYYTMDRNRSNETELYENGNLLEKIEINRNHMIDSGFNLTTGSTSVEMNQQCMVSPTGQNTPVHVTKSPKYSPSSSQKSGDYADSNYTPNSSQKSEFSPGSSKSGEYYLNSPRNSCQMSPDTSFNPDQVDSEKTMTSYQVPSNIRIQIKDDNLYDEAPRSLSVSPRQTYSDTNQETTYIRGSPNIPLSTNLAKLRANVESTRSESPTNSDDKVKTLRLSSQCMINSSLQSSSQNDESSQVTPPLVTMIPRVTSPLTVFMPESNTLMATESRSHSSTPLSFGVIPSARILIETKSPDRVRTPVSSPIISQVKTTGCAQMSTFHPRKAQPNDQILIASPKREDIGLYEKRSSSRMKLRSPDSPVPMADSPSQVLSAHQNHRHMEERFERSKSANLYELSHQPPQAFQDKPQRSMSPQFRQASPPKVIKRPEPIYIKRQAPQTVVPPLAITSEEEKESCGSNERSDMLLVQASPERIPLQSSNNPIQQVVSQQKLQSFSQDLPEIINMQQRITLQPISSPVQSDSNIVPEKSEALQLRKKLPSPSHERPQGIYGDQRVSVEPIYGRQEIAREQIDLQRSHEQDPIYGQRMSEPIYGRNPNKQSSPSKRQTLQHLEAFYWQQKALEDPPTTTNSPTVSNRSPQDSKAEPRVREAISWQQLKKLNEEEQRKIFERNQFEEINEMAKKKLQIQPAAKEVDQGQEHLKQMYWQINAQPKNSVATKPPIVGQKVQNQPVLVVRPQQAIRDQNFLKNQRSKSVSPHFVRNDERRSLQLPKRSTGIGDSGFGDSKFNSTIVYKSTTPPIYEENGDRRNPPPIFKRGSLISNSSSSVDYGTVGTKRVSFSNQSNSPEIGSGNWPTKHGLAPEPPTRKHRTEEKIPDTTDLSFTRMQEENQNNANNIYGNIVHESEYDAKPLPPPPMRDGIMIRRCNSMRDNRNQRIEVQRGKVLAHPRRWIVSESESGSEAGEVQRILQRRNEEEWNPGGKGHQSNDTGGSGRVEGEGGSNELPGGRRSGGIGVLGNVGVGRTSTSGSGGGRSRDEPRRHTLSGDHAPSLHHQQFNAQQLHPLHPHHLPPPHGQYSTPPRHGTMDLESPLPRGYPPPSTAMLFDEDPGIMSEVETSSTGFRRGGKQRSSLPVVRTPSKTLERPLGLVFLQYRKETKRALLPNEITSIDTVKALFVRSFPKQLTMEYLDSPDVKVYIHDSNKDMFYELEDHRSHLRDIRDRSVLRLIEKNDIVGMPGPLQGVPVGGQGLPPHWEDQSYFSEPEFDSEFQHQHIHKSKAAKNTTSGNYYMGGSSTLPRGGSIMRAYSPAASAILAGPNATPTQPKVLGTPGGGVAPAKPLRGYQCGKTPLGSLGGSARFSRDSSVSLYSIPDRIHGESGYMSSPERGVTTGIGRYPGPYSTQSSYEEPYYSQYSGTVTPVIDEEASDTELLEESYSLYGVKPPGRPPSGPPRSPFPSGAPALPPGQTYDVTRIRVEHMERQLANLTGLVQKALTHAPHTSPSPRDYLQVPAGRDPYTRSAESLEITADDDPGGSIPHLQKDSAETEASTSITEVRSDELINFSEEIEEISKVASTLSVEDDDDDISNEQINDFGELFPLETVHSKLNQSPLRKPASGCVRIQIDNSPVLRTATKKPRVILPIIESSESEEDEIDSSKIEQMMCDSENKSSKKKEPMEPEDNYENYNAEDGNENDVSHDEFEDDEDDEDAENDDEYDDDDDDDEDAENDDEYDHDDEDDDDDVDDDDDEDNDDDENNDDEDGNGREDYLSSDEYDETLECPQVPLKRRREADPLQWRQNKRRILRNSGKEYIRAERNEFEDDQWAPSRAMEQPCNCNKNCSEKINDELRKRIFDDFWKLGDCNCQNNVLASLVLEVFKARSRTGGASRRKYTRKWRLKRGHDFIQVCKPFFLGTFNISETRVANCLKKKRRSTTGALSQDKRGHHIPPNKIAQERIDFVKQHILSLPVVPAHYVRRKSTQRYVEGHLNQTRAYKLYCSYALAHNMDPVSQPLYSKQLKKLKISFYQPRNDRCWCSDFHLWSQEEREADQEAYEIHVLRKDRARTEYQSDKDLAKTDRSIMTACFDMQAILFCPMFYNKVLYYKRKLANFNLTVYVTNTNRGYCYMWDELKANKGSIEVSSCLKKFILTEVPSIVETLNLYADNCPGQNKNSILTSALMYCLLKHPSLKVINLKFLEVGHTYQEADGVHSCINAAAKSVNIYVPEDWMRVAKSAKTNGKPYHVHEMCQDHFLDFKSHRDKIGLNEKMQLPDGSKLVWRNLRLIQLRKNSPRSIFIKTDYDDHYNEISLSRDFPLIEPHRKYCSPLAISKTKWQDLKSMCNANLISREYHDYYRRLPHIGDKSVSFEKSVSFSDEPPDMNSPKQHSPQHAADTKPTKPAIKSSTLPRMSSQERDRHKPNLPPKPVALAAGGYIYRDLALTPEMYNQLRGLQKKAKDLRQEVRNLRRMSQAQAHTVRETIRDTFITIRAMLLSGGDAAWTGGDSEKMRLSREEDLYKQEMIRLEKDLTELESTVEELRGNVINRKTRVNMSDVENMALILSKSSKTVADLKVRFPSLQEGMKGLLSSEMEKVVREEKFLKEEPERLESALRRCKKLTGTLVTLKRLASVQEQRLPNAVSLDSEETPPITPTSGQHSKTTTPVPAERTHLGSASIIGGGSNPSDSSTANQQRPENALDALLDELQTFSRPSSQLSQVSLTNNQINHIPTMLEIGRSSSQIIQSSIRPPNISEIGRKGSIDSSSSAINLQLMQSGTTTLRRLHSYPSSSDTDTSPPIARIQVNDNGIQLQQQKPPVPERNAELLQLATSRRVPPPPPPRTSSRSPLASPTSPQLPPRNPTSTLRRGRGAKEINKPPMALPGSINSDADLQAGLNNILSTSNSSSCESINSQEGMQNKKGRQEQLEQRHQELLRKQKALQEQYARLQQLQRNTSGLTTVPPTPPDLLKKTGSESNLLAKMGLSMSAANSGSLTSLTTKNNETVNELQNNGGNNNLTTTSKIYETDIL